MRPTAIKVAAICERVVGLKKLDEKLFDHTEAVFSAVIPRVQFNVVSKQIKSHLNKFRYLKRKVSYKDTENIVIPVTLKRGSSEVKAISDKAPEISFAYKEVTYGYDSFNVQEILSTILPADVPVVSNFAQIGHICHLNLRKAHSEYEEIIGQVILDKVPSCRTVVTKEKSIENEFRTLPLRVIAGDAADTAFITEHKEHGCTYRMDFRTVYWNSRLQEEHQNVTEYIANTSMSRKVSVIDACCGIGPFIIPLAKRKKKVAKFPNIHKIYANDLNPDSMKWLRENVVLNKVTGYVEIEEEPLDGAEFVKQVLERGSVQNDLVYILMNLPRFSVSVLMPKLVGILDETHRKQLPESIRIIAHHMCPEDGLCFNKDSFDKEKMFNQVQESLPKSGFRLEQFWSVRQLVGEKYLRILVDVNPSVLIATTPQQTDNATTEKMDKSNEVCGEPPTKMSKVE